MSRFVRPESETLHLSNDDTLTVRARLNAGEEGDMFALIFRATGGDLHYDPVAVNAGRIAGYLLDWTIRDDAGRPVPVRERPLREVYDIVRGLDPDDFAEVREAIDAHILRVEQARVEKKTRRAGASASIAPSPSSDASASDTTRSTNSTLMSTT